MAIKFLNTATAATQAVGDNSTKIATTAYADAAASAIPIGNYLPLSAGASKPLTGGLHIPHYIYHAGDTGTHIGYPSVSRFTIATGSATRVDVTNAGLSLGDYQTNISVSEILDEEDMASDSATALATQQSIKAYVDAHDGGAGVYLPLAGGTLTGNTNLTGSTKKLILKSGAQLGFEDATPTGTIYLYNDGGAISKLNIGGAMWVEEAGKVFINASTSIPSRNENFQVTGQQIITNTGTNAATLYLGYNSSGSTTVQLGRGRTADGLSYIDLNGEVMAAGDYGFRIMRRAGVNAVTDLIQVGTGNLTINAQNGADTVFTNTNVGINTTSPNQKLHVNGATQLGDINSPTSFGTVALKVVEGTIASGPTLGSGAVGAQAVLYSNGLFGMYTGVSNNGDTWMQSQRNDTGTSTYDILLNPLGGNVGIGTITPYGKLDVAGNIRLQSANQIYFGGTGSIPYWSVGVDNTTNNNFVIGGSSYYSGDRDILLNPVNNGNVGIGTTSPSEKLQVVGNTLLNGIKFNTGYGQQFISAGTGTTINFGQPTSYVQNIFVQGTIKASSSVQMGNNTAAASSANAGSTRYRVSGNNSYMDMSMRTGSTTYAWVNIVQNNW